MDTSTARLVALLAMSTLALAWLPACGDLPAPRHRVGDHKAGTAGTASDTSDDADGDEKPDAQAKLKKLREERDDASADLEESQLELKLTELRTNREQADQEVALAEAQRALDEARADLKHFVEVERTHRIAEAELGLDRSAEYAEQAAAELKELEAMYAEEEFATMTKELVLRRGKKSREFAARGLANQKTDVRTLKEHKLPKERRDLEHALETATREVTEAKGDLALGTLERELTLLRARRGVRELEKKVKDLNEKIIKAESEAARKARESTKDA